MFFFRESIKSDKSDIDCFKGHILNKEIDQAKVINILKKTRGILTFDQSAAKTARYSNLPRDELETLFIPEDVTGAEGSLNNHCSNTPDTSGVTLNIKKKVVTCFVIGGKPTKGKTKGILLCKLIFCRDWRHLRTFQL